MFILASKKIPLDLLGAFHIRTCSYPSAFGNVEVDGATKRLITSCQYNNEEVVLTEDILEDSKAE